MAQYSAKGRTPDQILADFEAGLIAKDYGGNAAEYLQAALAAATARSQERWTIVLAVAACLSTVAAIAAVVVALS